MKIEENKEYKTRSGLTAFVLKIEENKIPHILAKIKGHLGTFRFYKDGKAYTIENMESEWDLVEEINLVEEIKEEESEIFYLKFDPAWLVNEKGTIKEGWACYLGQVFLWTANKKRVTSIASNVFFHLEEAKDCSEKWKIVYRKELEQQAQEILDKLKELK